MSTITQEMIAKAADRLRTLWPDMFGEGVAEEIAHRVLGAVAGDIRAAAIKDASGHILEAIVTDVRAAALKDAAKIVEHSLRLAGQHQLYCNTFGKTLGWHDGAIRQIEPFMLAYVAELSSELIREIERADGPVGVGARLRKLAQPFGLPAEAFEGKN